MINDSRIPKNVLIGVHFFPLFFFRVKEPDSAKKSQLENNHDPNLFPANSAATAKKHWFMGIACEIVRAQRPFVN